jgi:hypothetical protein
MPDGCPDAESGGGKTTDRSLPGGMLVLRRLRRGMPRARGYRHALSYKPENIGQLEAEEYGGSVPTGNEKSTPAE